MVGIVALLLVFHGRITDRAVRVATQSLLRRQGIVETADYAALLRFEDAYAITELHVRAGEWMVGRPLAELHLTSEGVVVLGIHRSDGTFTGACEMTSTNDHAPQASVRTAANKYQLWAQDNLATLQWCLQTPRSVRDIWGSNQTMRWPDPNNISQSIKPSFAALLMASERFPTPSFRYKLCRWRRTVRSL